MNVLWKESKREMLWEKSGFSRYFQIIRNWDYSIIYIYEIWNYIYLSLGTQWEHLTNSIFILLMATACFTLLLNGVPNIFLDMSINFWYKCLFLLFPMSRFFSHNFSFLCTNSSFQTKINWCLFNEVLPSSSYSSKCSFCTYYQSYKTPILV